MAKGRGKFSFDGQFVGRLVEMLESPAYRALSRAALLTLTRFEIEFAGHGGMKGGQNGKLVCTFEDLKRYGVHKDAISPAIRELVALGFVEITRRGIAGNAEFRLAAQYRLTYFPTKEGDATQDWRKIASMEEAERIAKDARANFDPKAVARGKKRNPAPGFRHASTPVSRVETDPTPPPVFGATAAHPVSGLLSRSRGGTQLLESAANVISIRIPVHSAPTTDPEPAE